MRRSGLSAQGFAIAVWLGAGGAAEAQADRAACAAAVLVAAAGPVEVVPADGAALRATTGMRLCGGDVVRTPPATPDTPVEAAVRFTIAGKTVRLGPNTEIGIPRDPAPGGLSLGRGVVYVISQVRRAFTVQAGVLTAGIDGTEATVARDPDAGALALVREGAVSVTGAGGARVALAAGEAAFADAGGARKVGPADAPALSPALRPFVASPTGAVDWTARFPPDLLATRGDPAVVAASRLIAARRYTEAFEALDCAAGDPGRGRAGALCVTLAAVLNRREGPGSMADAVARPTGGASSAYLVALSFARQGLGDVAGARAAGRAAAAEAAGDAFVAARAAELDLLAGDALTAQRRLAPFTGDGCTGDAYALAVLGLARLADDRFDDARATLDCAVAQDGALPLARVGRGLAAIRRGDRADGLAELEVAIALAPRNAATRAWLGRALLDAGDGERAAKQFALATEEDPDDPTPRLFSAIRRFAANDPVGALADIEAADARGGARATVRDASGLAEDAAVRGAALGRVYDVLGFDLLAQAEAARAVQAAPASPAANRFQSESFRGLEGAGRAQTSAALRADLLSPPTGRPLQPQTLVGDLALLDTTGPARTTFAEFAPLFDANGVQVALSGGVGTQDSWFNELSVGALHDRASLAFGQYHVETDGFRRNNDLEHDVLIGRGAFRASRAVTLFGEYGYRRTEAGDRVLRFDLDGDVFPDYRGELERNRARLGAAVRPAPGWTLLTLLHYSDTDISNRDVFSDEFFGFPTTSEITDRQSLETLNLQAQVIREVAALPGGRRIDLTLGGALGETDFTDAVTDAFTFFGATTVVVTPFERTFSEYTAYGYADMALTPAVTATLGGAAANVTDKDETGAANGFRRSRFLPKLGVRAALAAGVTLRAAYTQSMVMEDADGDRIEPSTVAGFRQVFDGVRGTVVEQFGVAGDARLGGGWRAGAEAVWREHDIPQRGGPSADTDEIEASALLSRTVGRRWALSGGLRYVRATSNLDADLDRFETLSAPFGASYFHPSGFFANGVVTVVDHEFADDARAGDDAFALVDAGVGFRAPGGRAFVGLEVRNLFDTDFGFESRPPLATEGILNRVAAPQFARERSVMLTGTINF